MRYIGERYVIPLACCPRVGRNRLPHILLYEFRCFIKTKEPTRNVDWGKSAVLKLKRWSKLPHKQKLHLLLEQTEWALFMDTLLDINIDKRSLDAFVEAKRLYYDGRWSDETMNIMNEAIFVESHLRNEEWLNHNGDIVWGTKNPPITTEFIIAYMCSGVILHMVEQSESIDYDREIVGYLIPLDGTTPKGHSLDGLLKTLVIMHWVPLVMADLYWIYK